MNAFDEFDFQYRRLQQNLATNDECRKQFAVLLKLLLDAPATGRLTMLSRLEQFEAKLSDLSDRVADEAP